MIRPPPYTATELRFPVRLEKVRQTGIEIAQTIGQFGSKAGEGRPIEASVNNFYILYFTPFNQPTAWRHIDWSHENIRRQLYGLMISYERGTCLFVLWSTIGQEVLWFRDPSEDSWDKNLRGQWIEFKAQRLKLERRHLRPA